MSLIAKMKLIWWNLGDAVWLLKVAASKAVNCGRVRYYNETKHASALVQKQYQPNKIQYSSTWLSNSLKKRSNKNGKHQTH